MIRRPPRSTLFPTRRSSDPLDRATRISYADDFGIPNGRLQEDRKSTRLNSSHEWISYAVFCLKKKNEEIGRDRESHESSGQARDSLMVHAVYRECLGIMETVPARARAEPQLPPSLDAAAGHD